MRTWFGTALAVAAAFVVGVAAGWFAAGAWGGTAVSSKPPYHNSCEISDGRAGAPNGRARRLSTADSKPRRKALIRSSANADVQKRILENEIRYLEKCIAAAKGSIAQPDVGGHSYDGRAGSSMPAEKKRETHTELVARLMKLPTEGERLTAVERLDEETPLTVGEMKELCPKWAERSLVDEEKLLKNLDEATKTIAKRIGILDAFDLSGLNDEERKVHADLMEHLAEFPDAYAKVIVPDSTPIGELADRIKKYLSVYRQGVELETKERDVLITQAVKRFEVPDGDAAELRATLGEVRRVTSSGYFMRKD